MHQRHLVNLVETVPNSLHFRSEEVKIMFFLIIGSPQKCKFSKMNETCSVAILFHIYIYIYQIYASPSVLGSDRDSAVPLTFFSRHVLIVCRFFWGRVLYRLSQRISLNWNFLNFQNSTLPARLSLAAERGHLQVVQELLAKQATCNDVVVEGPPSWGPCWSYSVWDHFGGWWSLL